MEKQQYDYGMIGLGTMGRNLVFNINDHGYTVAGFDKDTKQVDTLKKEAAERKVFATADIKEFVNSLKPPRVILMLVPAGPIVDAVIAELKPLLGEQDLLMDCGNSHYIDTDRRNEQLAKENLHFMGVGVSGGEAGARYGPSIMPGGNAEAYKRVEDMLKAVSAKANNEPCVTWLGPGSAGHYVKMVHNGIEYGIMQLIAESYHLMKVFGGLNNAQLADIFAAWNKGLLQSYLIEITADIFAQKDDLSPNDLVDMILDSAKQNGTGAWTSEDAMKLLVPTPVIDAAVSFRNLSAQREERKSAAKLFVLPTDTPQGDKTEFIGAMAEALHFAMIVTYAQGFSLLGRASTAYKYGLKLQDIAAIWQGGCIIRAALLTDLRSALTSQLDSPDLILNEAVATDLKKLEQGIKTVIVTGVQCGVPMPAMMAALSYIDSYRGGWLPANLIQAQRDYFGAHTYERTDRAGIFHTHWQQK